ncbi:hypothetical protein PCANC_25757 [Puccinia coronata f. sp. avenae]|uniref:CRAL-TRIO domain-containing protein n=1 Tax=Puccinia coronata f. sp. avenae TaxID=200324 RepID=A0A2N5T7P7_9BASI|nr:hypothetical protein PCASD_22220 [Puccinia coronata f. sp. avenae]PLW27741.1 hypothetical protein PCANC_25757 [Puccinia coronata f. sp. avenae]
MSSTESISKRQEQYHQSFQQHLPLIHSLHHQAIHQLLPQLTDSLELSPRSIQLATYFLNDRLSLFRFLHRHRFDIQLTLEALAHSITWRLKSNLDLLAPNSLEPIYLRNPLMYFHPDLKDRWGRTSAILNLRYLTRTEDGSLDGLKEFIGWNCELARRSLYETNLDFINQICSKSNNPQLPSSTPSSPSPPSLLSNIPVSLQISLIVDLKGVSINNLEVELLPYMLHLVKDNFPDMLGAVFILNYGWMYAGMWQVVKRILSQSTLDRILFPSQAELFQFFDKANLLQEHGGLVAHQYDPQHDAFIHRFGKPTASTLPDFDANPQTNSSLSRHPSLESLHDIFFSTANTPFHQLSNPCTPTRSGTFSHSHRRPSWLNMTSYHPSQISSSSISEALQRNKSKASNQVWLKSCSNSSFQLQLPVRSQHERDEKTSEDSAIPALLTCGRSSASSASSSSLPSETDREISSQQPNDDQCQDPSRPTPLVKSNKRKRDYFCIKLLIKLGYFLRTLQMLFKLLSSKLFSPLYLHPRRRDMLTPQQRHPGALGEERYDSHNRVGRRPTQRDLGYPHLSLHQLFLLLNFQRKKIVSTLGCLFFFLFFCFKKKKV